MKINSGGRIIIRITLGDNRSFFINESREGIILVEDILNAFRYRSTLEFKVTWKLMRIMSASDPYQIDYSFNKKDVKKFESIDTCTLDVKKFDVKKKEIAITDEIHVDSETFRRLMRCGITSSHWLYDKDDRAIPFPKTKDFDEVVKIIYFRRGLTFTITSHKNWLDRYDKRSWHPCYELHHKVMLNPIIQQICLLDQDSCYVYNIYEETKNE